MDNAFASAGNLTFVSEPQVADYHTTDSGRDGDNAFATAEKKRHLHRGATRTEQQVGCAHRQVALWVSLMVALSVSMF